MNADKVGRITLEGMVTEFSLPTGSFPSMIVDGPDGAMWTALEIGSIARLTLVS